MRLGRDPREFPDYKQPECFTRGDHSAGQTCAECNPEYYLNNNRERKVEHKNMAQVVGKIGVLTTDAKGNYKLKVDDKWYGTGSTDDPGITQGQMVQFDFELSKPWKNPQGQMITFNNITKGTLKPVTAGQPRVEQHDAAGQSTAVRPGAPLSKDDYWRNKEARDLENEGKREITQQQIQLQAARNAAIEFVKILAGEKAIVYSTAQTKQTPAARLDTIETLVNHYTTQFLAETQAVGQVIDGPQTANEDAGDVADQTDLG